MEIFLEIHNLSKLIQKEIKRLQSSTKESLCEVICSQCVGTWFNGRVLAYHMEIRFDLQHAMHKNLLTKEQGAGDFADDFYHTF
jgi:hypothetical protein